MACVPSGTFSLGNPGVSTESCKQQPRWHLQEDNLNKECRERTGGSQQGRHLTFETWSINNNMLHVTTPTSHWPRLCSDCTFHTSYSTRAWCTHSRVWYVSSTASLGSENPCYVCWLLRELSLSLYLLPIPPLSAWSPTPECQFNNQTSCISTPRAGVCIPLSPWAVWCCSACQLVAPTDAWNKALWAALQCLVLQVLV